LHSNVFKNFTRADIFYPGCDRNLTAMNNISNANKLIQVSRDEKIDSHKIHSYCEFKCEYGKLNSQPLRFHLRKSLNSLYINLYLCTRANLVWYLQHIGTYCDFNAYSFAQKWLFYAKRFSSFWRKKPSTYFSSNLTFLMTYAFLLHRTGMISSHLTEYFGIKIKRKSRSDRGLKKCWPVAMLRN
jgi:hypothetical protein